MTSHDCIELLKSIVGRSGWLDRSDDLSPHIVDYRGVYSGEAALVLKPKSTAEVSHIVRVCNSASIGIVPQGGNTSLCGGAVPAGFSEQIVLNLSRMRVIRDIDTVNDTATVEAGVTLHALRSAAEDVDRLFPVRIGSEGSCQIGGLISTNAGGTAVLEYGNMRDSVLGLEVVLPDGQIWNGLRGLRKDNTGYDIKHLFVGGEGTLGIVTAAVLKLTTRPRQTSVALASVGGIAEAVALLKFVQKNVGASVTAFELMSRESLELSLAFEKLRCPISSPSAWNVLIEISSRWDNGDLDAALAEALEEASEQNLVLDAAIASNGQQIADFWRIRENISDAQTREGASARCDVSVPISRVAQFTSEATRSVLMIAPESRMIVYGHVGDGNLHFNPMRPLSMSKDAFLERAGHVTRAVETAVQAYGGSISAEHGIGQAKRAELVRHKATAEMDILRAIKRSIDPKNIMNRGKLL